MSFCICTVKQIKKGRISKGCPAHSEQLTTKEKISLKDKMKTFKAPSFDCILKELE